MRYLLATVVAVLLLCSPASAQLSQATVDNASPTKAAGARTVYVVDFQTASELAGAERIRFEFPLGTGFTGWSGGTLRDVTAGQDVGGCSRAVDPVLECWLHTGRSIAAGHAVRATFEGITNPGTFDQHRVLLSTTSHPTPVPSAFFDTVPGGQLTQITLDNSAPSRAAGALTNYVLRFALSATGGLSAQANSRITITFPPLTGYAGFNGGTVRDVTADRTVGSCSTPENARVECYLHTDRAVGAGATLEVTLSGITNSTETGDDKVVRVDTTSDIASLPSAPFTIVAANPVTGVTVTNAFPTNAAGARTRYLVGFTTSPTGALAGAADSRITLTLPAGTTFDGFDGGTVSAAGDTVGSCSSPSGLTIECWLFGDETIAADTHVSIALGGVTNPATPRGDATATVSTTSDPGTVPSGPYSIVPAGSLTDVTVANGSPSPAASARTRYVIGFTTSATGRLARDANSRIRIVLPAGTTFAGWNGGSVRTGGDTVGACSAPSELMIECWLFTDAGVPPGAGVTIGLDGITNAGAGTKTLSVSTTSDPAAVPSAPFDVVAGGALRDVTVALSTPAPAAPARYVVRATTSATGALDNAANSRIRVRFPAGTTFAGWQGGSVRVAGTDVGACSTPSGITVECWLFTDRTVAAGARLELTFGRIVNPPGAGPHRLELSTTTDVPIVTSAAYAQDGAEPETTITSGPAGLTNDRTPTFTFTASHPATFECRVSNGAWAPCASPLTLGPLADGAYTLAVRAAGDPTPATRSFTVDATPPAAPPVSSPDRFETGQVTLSGTAEAASTVTVREAGVLRGTSAGPDWSVTFPATDGEHTYEIRATDAAGNVSAATTRTVVVARPLQATPTPTPTATPEPEPTFRQDVVVAPAAGTVQVCAKPGARCAPLAAGAAIPMGSTVDARKGAVVLTSRAAPGAPPQTARFSDGMFKVTQAGAITVLTLNEPLDCGKRKARAAQKKRKARSRKLWGDGKGRFRTKGQYSAATIRGTKWLVQDTCTTTLTRVTQGVVSVRDSVKRKTVTVRAGRRYTARARSR